MPDAEVERAFLFTDIEGSTQLWERHPPAMRAALARHDALLHRAASAHHGHVFKTVGDAFCIAFPTTEDALRAAVQAQRALQGEDWGALGAVKVRMAIHQGVAEARDRDYFGPPLNRVARLRDAGHGGQVLLSGAVYAACAAFSPEWTFLDRGEHRLKDLVDPERIYQLAAPGLPQDFPPLRTLSSHPNNLPAETTSFVGRVAEAQAVRALLERADVRLVTLTGFGGSGKTRLALEVAEAALERYPQGAWFADLAPLSDPTFVLPTVVRACGLEDDPAQTPLAQLSTHFKNARALLVLDNFEQVEDAADDLAALLRACAHLQILVTSRVLLNLSMEHEYEVPPLRPDDCATLFATRARQVQPTFVVTEENRQEIETLCLQLDGIPLAVELAAAQVRTLSPVEISQALDQRLQVLSTKLRDLPPRHRSLRGAIDWSYDLLSEPERHLFGALSVFVGGFTAEAVEVVCGAACHGPRDTFSLLSSLREKSLVRQTHEGDRRFTLLESLRQYGAERLREQEPVVLSVLRERHSQFFLRIAETEGIRLQGAGQEEAAATLDSEAANLAAGMEWMRQNGSLTGAARYGSALRRFWRRRGRVREGLELLERVVGRADEIEDRALRAALLFAAGDLAQDAGNVERALQWFEESRHLSEEIGDRRQAARALNGLGVLALSTGDLAKAEDAYLQSRDALRAVGDKPGEAMTLNNLGMLAYERGDYERAQALFHDSLHLREEMGDEISAADVWNSLGVVADARGDLEAACGAYERSRTLYEGGGDARGKAYALMNLASVALRRNDNDEAQRLYAASLHLLRDLGDRSGLAECLTGLGRVALARGDIGEASRLCREGLALHRENGDRPRFAGSLEALAEVAEKQQCPDVALALLSVADHLRREIGILRTPQDAERLARVESAARAAATDPAPALNLEGALNMALAMP